MMKFEQRWQEITLIKEQAIRALSVEGDYAEFGVLLGGTAEQIIHAIQPIKRTFHLFDTFQFFAEKIEMSPHENELITRFKPAVPYDNLETIKQELDKYQYPFYFHKGLFAEMGKDFNNPLAFVHLDADLYQSTKDADIIIKRNLVKGGIIVCHDYQPNGIWSGVFRAITEDYGDAAPPCGCYEIKAINNYVTGQMQAIITKL